MSKENQGMIAFARLTKVDVAKRLVYGRATQEIPDRAGEIFDYDTSKPYFEKWSSSQLDGSLGKSAGNVRAMHKDIAAGILVPEGGIVYNDSEKAVDVCAHVVDDAEWDKVQKGVYTGFSVGGRYIKKWEDPDLKKTRYTADPNEFSLVDRPAVPTATFFEVQKADGSVEKREFAKTEERVPLVRLDGADLGIAVPAASLPKPGAEFEFEKRLYQLSKIEGGKAFVEQVYAVAGDPKELEAFAKLLSDRGMTISQATEVLAKNAPAAGAEPADVDVKARAIQMAVDDKKIKAVSEFEKLEKSVQDGYVSAAKDALKPAAAAKTTGSTAAVEKRYGSATFADDKNRRWPIDTKEHAKASLSYWGLSKARAGYSADEAKAIGERIRKAAKDLGIDDDEAKKIEGALAGDLAKSIETTARLLAASDDVSTWEPDAKALVAKVDELAKAEKLDFTKDDVKVAHVERLSKIATAALAPEEEWKKYVEPATKAVEAIVLRKGLATCAQFAYVLDSLCQLAESVEMESYAEGDGSEIAARIYDSISNLGQCLQDCVAEEIKEEVSGETYKMAADAIGNLRKRAEDFKKAHIAVSARSVQKMHDTTVKMGAACEKGGVPNKGGVLETASGYRKAVDAVLAKVLPPLIPASCKVDDVAMAKVVDEVLAGIGAPAAEASGEPLKKLEAENADLKKRYDELEVRLKKVEAQPAPARIVVRAVDKVQDGGGAPADAGMAKAAAIAATVEPIKKADGTIDEVATATKIMRAMGGHNVTGGVSRKT